jgi:broad specificity phosphatase PhoE
MLLAALLKDADINVIFTSELERTVKTAEPLADGLGIKPKALPQLNVRFNSIRATLIASSVFSEAAPRGYRIGRCSLE